MTYVSPESPRKLGRVRSILTTLGGANNDLLVLADTDIQEATSRGFAALIPAIFGGLAAIIAFSYAFNASPVVAVIAGFGWAAIMLCLDLMLMSASSKRNRRSLTFTFLLRAGVSVLAAFVFGSTITLFMYQRDISTQVAKNAQTDLATYNAQVIKPAHGTAETAAQGTITNDQAAISRADGLVTSLTQKVETDEVQVTCEAQGINNAAGCGSGSGNVGKGSEYDVRVSELTADKQALANAKTQDAALRSRLNPQMTAAQTALTTAKTSQQSDYANAQERYASNTGLVQRYRALDDLENAYPSVRIKVLLLELLIITLDLTAVISKITSKTPAYDAVVEAAVARTKARAAIIKEDAQNLEDRSRKERATVTALHNEYLEGQTTVALRLLEEKKLRGELDDRMHWEVPQVSEFR